MPFFAFPEGVRRIIYTTNAIEALNSKLRRAVRTRGHFPNDDAAMKLLYLVLDRQADECGNARRANGSRPGSSSPSCSAKGSSLSDADGLSTKLPTVPCHVSQVSRSRSCCGHWPQTRCLQMGTVSECVLADHVRGLIQLLF